MRKNFFCNHIFQTISKPYLTPSNISLRLDLNEQPHCLKPMVYENCSPIPFAIENRKGRAWLEIRNAGLTVVDLIQLHRINAIKKNVLLMIENNRETTLHGIVGALLADSFDHVTSLESIAHHKPVISFNNFTSITKETPNAYVRPARLC